jgi:hypothetical protein
VPEKKASVQLPTGMAEGFDVPIITSTEKWSEIQLEDGTVLRIKPNVISAIRVNGQYDQDGNPMYAIKSSQVMAVVSAPDHLRKGAQVSKIQ